MLSVLPFHPLLAFEACSAAFSNLSRYDKRRLWHLCACRVGERAEHASVMKAATGGLGEAGAHEQGACVHMCLHMHTRLHVRARCVLRGVWCDATTELSLIKKYLHSNPHPSAPNFVKCVVAPLSQTPRAGAQPSHSPVMAILPFLHAFE